ncbi:choice-of-anchor D domain-containing protein [Myxococcota bacterium]|nr:choice-of-anchor D domain-containing protein [Myxococcota bacterium]
MRTRALLLSALGSLTLFPRCSCDEGEGIQRAAVELTLTYVETDSCSNAVIPRRVPDDFDRIGQVPSADFGSRGERRLEVRSTGSAPLGLLSVELAEPSPEFTVEVLSTDETTPASLPLTISPSRDPATPPAAIIKVSYSAQDANPDAVDLVVKTDDPNREEVRFRLTAGRGQLEVCGTNGCVSDARIDFGNVPIGTEGTQTLTLKNTGEGDLDLRAIRLTSESAELCAREATELPPGVTDCPLVELCRVLKPGEEYVVTVRYLPRDGGSDTGVITVVSGDASRGNVEVPINGVGAGPAVCPCLVDGTACNPVQVIDFGAVDVGSAAGKTVRLQSCGTDDVELTEAILETAMGPYFTGPEFTITQPFTSGRFATGQYSEGTIEYRPSAAGEHRGGLRYTIAQSQLRSWIALRGRAATCDLAVLPANLPFGTVAAGSTADRTVQISNNGTRDCTVTAITDPSNGFAIVNKPALPYSIPSGQSYDLTVRYTAPQRTSPTQDTSTFDVTSNEAPPTQTNTVTLTANGGGTPVCSLDVQPTGNLTIPIPGRDGQLRFGAVNIGYSKTLSIRVQNTGNTECRLENMALTTQSPSEFRAVPSSTLPHAISPGNTATIDVTFSPTGPAMNLLGLYGSLTNYVNFTMSGPGLMQTAWSIGITATPTVPTIDVIPDAIDFGLVTWERPQAPDMRSSCGSTTRNVNIYNSGNGALDIMSIAIDATSDPVFLITRVTMNGTPQNAPYAFSIAPGDAASVELRFFPSRINPSNHQGLLVIENSVTGMNTPVTVPLTGGGTPNTQQTDTFSQLADNKIDILWVVDDSGSMSEEQTSLGNNFQNFISYADTIGADYQVGVTTTEINDAVSGKLWACNGFNPIIRSSDANRVQAFQCAAEVTSPPNGNRRPNPGGSDEAEAGLQAARIALSPPVRDMENAGFLRDDARLAVIIVSDEEDQSPGSINLYVDFFRNVKGFANPQLVSVSAIAGDVPGGCATAEAGARYYDAAQQLGGQFGSICSASWNTLLQNIGLGVFALRTAWTLSRPADPASITVRVNGNAVPGNATNGWTFDSTTNTITFHGSAVPPAGASVSVQYGAVCLP